MTDEKKSAPNASLAPPRWLLQELEPCTMCATPTHAGAWDDKRRAVPVCSIPCAEKLFRSWKYLDALPGATPTPGKPPIAVRLRQILATWEPHAITQPLTRLVLADAADEIERMHAIAASWDAIPDRAADSSCPTCGRST